MTHISAVICTRNRPRFIAQAVSSVLANDHDDFDLTVVDQSDDDTTGQIVQALMREHPNLRYLYSSIPGASRARNIGAWSTKGEIIAFTDDDCIVTTDWLRQIDAHFAANPTVDMIFGQVLLPIALQNHAAHVPVLTFPRARYLRPDEPFELMGMSANQSVRRHLFDAIEGFDEVLGVGGPLFSGEDFDFQYRVYLSGGTVLLSPDVNVDHYGVRDEAEWPATLRRYGSGDAAFFLKHVRCGDTVALRMLVRTIVKLSVRETLIKMRVRVRPAHAPYLLALCRSLPNTFQYDVNRRTRKYGMRRDASTPRAGQTPELIGHGGPAT